MHNLTVLSSYLSNIADDIDFGMFAGDPADVAESASVVIYMVQAAMESMEKVIEIGEKVEDKEFENFMLIFISTILFVLPSVGALLGTLSGLANLRRILIDHFELIILSFTAIWARSILTAVRSISGLRSFGLSRIFGMSFMLLIC